MSEYITLKPSQRPTVSAVGEFAYKDVLRHVPAGTVMLEVVPEPDNPHDSQAISIRYNGSVIGYIPRERTKTYWPVVARVAASGKVARVQGNVYSNPTTDHYDVSVHLLAGDRALEGVTGLKPKAPSYSVPGAYVGTPPRGITTGVTFTQSEVDAETARRRRANPTSTPSPSTRSEGNNFLGCAIAALIVGILLILLL